jgi:hypothetical protein
VNDDGTNVDPVEMTELSPTRTELIARVRARGRQIRARRRLAVTGLTALVVLAIAAPAIAIGARSSSRGVTPATVVHRKGDFRVAVVLNYSSPPCAPGSLAWNPPLAPTQHADSACLELGDEVMSAADVRSASVVYDDTQGWIVNLDVGRAAVARLAAEATNRQAAIIVNNRVVSAPVVNPGISGTTVTISPLATREQAIELATEILGRAPSHVDAAPVTLSTTIELPSDTIVAGSDLKGTLVVDNASGKPIDLSRGGCHAKFAVTLRNETFTNEPLYTSDCALGPWILATGVTRWNFTLIASYLGPRPTGSRSLPVGNYEAILVTDTPGFLPDPTPVPVRVVAAAPPTVGALSLQTGKRSIKLLVPAGWKFTWIDAGGSGSSSTWTNPHDPNEKIDGTTGVEVGSWWETDGVAGSINPRGFLPAGAHIDRVNRTTFLYSVDEPNGYRIDGVWIADLYQGLPYDFVSAQVELPASLHATATTIVNRFISDRKALPPSLTRP